MHVALVSLANVPIYISPDAASAVSIPSDPRKGNSDDGRAQSGNEYRVVGNENIQELTAEKIPARMHSIVNRWGASSVKLRPVIQWEEHKSEAVKMLERCERLYLTLLQAEGWSVGKLASEHVR